METTATTRTDALLERIKSTEAELREQLERIHGCLERVRTIQDDDVARFHGLLLTLRCSLDTVKAIDRTGVARLLDRK